MNDNHNGQVSIDRLDERLANYAKSTGEKLDELKVGQKLTHEEIGAVSTRLTQLEARERERNGQLYSLVQWRQSHEAWANELAAEVGRMEEESEVTALVSKTKHGVWVGQANFIRDAIKACTSGFVFAVIVFALKHLGFV